MININPIKINGSWDEGYALDVHVVKSIFLGYDEYELPHFDNLHSEVGEIVFQLKYKNNFDKIDELAEVAYKFIKEIWKIDLYGVIAVPPSKSRFNQPVFIIAQKIADLLKKPCSVDFFKKDSNLEIKNLKMEEKLKLDTSNLIIKCGHLIKEKSNILIVDDLYSSGFTMNLIVDSLKKDPNIGKIYVLTMTKTKGR